jgi:hypothetical protein
MDVPVLLAVPRQGEAADLHEVHAWELG